MLPRPSLNQECFLSFWDVGIWIFTAVPKCKNLSVPANSISLAGGYVNVHLLPMYQQKTAYGSKGFPWTSDICKREVTYAKGICSVAEELHNKSFLGYEMCLNDLDDEDIVLVVSAFRKVWMNLDLLKD